MVYREPIAAHLKLRDAWRAAFDQSLDIALWLTTALAIRWAVAIREVQNCDVLGRMERETDRFLTRIRTFFGLSRSSKNVA